MYMQITLHNQRIYAIIGTLGRYLRKRAVQQVGHLHGERYFTTYFCSKIQSLLAFARCPD